MRTFWVIDGQRVKTYLIVVVAAFFAAGVIYIEREAMGVFSNLAISSQDAPQAIYRVKTDEKKVALTFDISWGQERPAQILDVLAELGVKKATFFLSAPWAEHHPELVQRIREMGFEIGSHGHKHMNYTRLNEAEIREQIQKAHRILTSVSGLQPTLLRPPNGDVDKRLLRIAEEMGYTVVLWGTNSHDWKNPGVDQIVEHVLSGVEPGDIILLHASDSAKQTHEALPQIISQLKGDGYQLVTVTELITGTESEIKEMN